MHLRWVKTAEGHATGKTPLAMIENTLPFAKPDFYKLQVGVKNETTGEIHWTDVEIGVETPTTVTRYIAGKAVRSAE
jgi:hypothetical protein